MKVFDNKRDCCGCTACMNICPHNAIKMVEDEEGFTYPEIDETKCIKCGLCKNICAFNNGYKMNKRLNEPLVYAVKSKNDEVRMKSSSGGMFTIISDYVLENNGIVYGVKFDENFKAVHTRCETKKQRDKCRGSKYSQSDLNDTFSKVKEDLKKGKMVMFTGTPCQVAGINKFLERTDTSNLILVDIVCHCVPSPKLFGEYIRFCEKKNKSKIVEYYHRTKDKGWKALEKAIYQNGKEDSKSLLSQAWNIIFYSKLATRPSCYECRYTNIKRPSDITIADFWGIEKFNPEFADEKGVSLALLNTEKGKDIFDKIKNNIEYIQKNIEEAVEKNPQLERNIRYDENERKIFWKDYKEKGIKYIIKKYGKCNFKRKLKRTIKKVIGKDE